MTTTERIAAQAEARRLAGGTKGVIAVDFDDTLTADGGIEMCVSLRAAGYGIVIFTANADHEGIRSWLKARWPYAAGEIPPVTDIKPQALFYIDDKAIRFTSWEMARAYIP